LFLFKEVLLLDSQFLVKADFRVPSVSQASINGLSQIAGMSFLRQPHPIQEHAHPRQGSVKEACGQLKRWPSINITDDLLMTYLSLNP
jgi:hypothetical protein